MTACSIFTERAFDSAYVNVLTITAIDVLCLSSSILCVLIYYLKYTCSNLTALFPWSEFAVVSDIPLFHREETYERPSVRYVGWAVPLLSVFLCENIGKRKS